MTLARIAAATLSRIDTPPYSPDKSNVETSALPLHYTLFLPSPSFLFPFISIRQIFHYARSVLGAVMYPGVTGKREYYRGAILIRR